MSERVCKIVKSLKSGFGWSQAVESRTGVVALSSVSLPCSSNRTCRATHPAFRLASPKGKRRVANSVPFINETAFKEWIQNEFAAKVREPVQQSSFHQSEEQLQLYESRIQCTVW